jgi:nuclear GTP-binding protein
MQMDSEMADGKEDGFFMASVQLKEQEVQKRHWYFRELKKVVDMADVIIEVLDARDPLGCRCPEMEKMALEKFNPDGSMAKRIILVINKIDLVPQDVVGKWVKYFQREYPTLAFKSSTQHQKGHLTQTAGSVEDASEEKLGMSGCVGGQALVGLLKNYSRAVGMTKKSITVGVVGFPNVGKSSIINSLKRSRAVQVGSTPGLTKTVQSVKLDKTISLVDSPGVLFSSGDDTTLVLRNCLRVEQLEDPVAAVNTILEKVHHNKLMELYRIPRFLTTEDFLGLIANKYGKLTKGGVPNLILAARQVLEDWNNNKIPFYTIPPQIQDVTGSVVLSKWSEEFNVAQYEASTASELKEMAEEQKRTTTEYHVFASSNNPPPSAKMNDSESDVEEEEEERVMRLAAETQAKKARAPVGSSDLELGGPQTNKRMKQQMKKLQKQRREQARSSVSTKVLHDQPEEDSQEAEQVALQLRQRQQILATQNQSSDAYDFASDWQ